MPEKWQPDTAEVEAFRRRLEDLAARAGGRKALWAKAGLSESNFSRMLGGKRQIANPGVFTVKALATAGGSTVSELLGEKGATVRVTPYDVNESYRDMIDALEAVDMDDRREIVRHALWSARHAQPAQPGTVLTFPMPEESDDFPLPPIPAEQWKLSDTDYPRPLHAKTKPIATSVAAGLARNPDDDTLIPSAEILNSIREIRDPRINVIRVSGRSMHPVLQDGWLVMIDPSRALFRAGRVVMVYLKDEGTTIGVLMQEGERYWLRKLNPDYGGPMEIELPRGEWYPVATVVRVVDAPIGTVA